MNEPEGFLSRWSRRKHDAGKDADQTDHSRESGNPESDLADSRGDERNEAESSGESAGESAEKSKQEPEFDLSHLPSLEDITAETDIRPFLARGVPASLRQAALRRMWVADPNIRDFIGIAENQWDFTVTGGAPGFDLSPPTGDIARMIADIFGEKREVETSAVIEQAADTKVTQETPPDAAAETNEAPAPDQIAVIPDSSARGDANEAAAQPNSVRRTQFADTDVSPSALQQDAAPRDDAPRDVRRSHGGAMPK